jgi:hypothetical protein
MRSVNFIANNGVSVINANWLTGKGVYQQWLISLDISIMIGGFFEYESKCSRGHIFIIWHLLYMLW